MTRGSRHKSSRHSLKDAKESSDSEDYSSPRDQKSKENGSSRVLKDSASSEKRRFDLKDTKELYGLENLETEGRGSSKLRKERYDEGATDRWNGGSNDELGVPSKKSKPSVDSKSKRRDESVGLQCDGEELKKSSGKGEGRHRESSRKEGRNGGGERERKGRDGRSDRVVLSEEHRVEKQVEKSTEDVLTSLVLENHLEIRRRRSAGSFDGDKHKDDVGDSENRQSSSKNDVMKDGKRRSDKHKDDRIKEKCWEDADRDGKHRESDEQLVKDQVSRSNRRDLRHENDAVDLQHKRNKPQNSDLNRELTKAKAREGDLDAVHDKEHDQDHRSYERDRDQESRRGRDRDRDHDYDRHGNQNHSHGRARDRYYDYECDLDHDESHLEDQYTKYMESKGRKRSPNDQDDSIDTRSKNLKNGYHSNEKKRSFSDDLVEPDARGGRSESRSRHADASLSSHRQKDSPSSLSCVGRDEYRYPDQKDLRDQYSKKEERSKSMSNRDQSVVPGAQEKDSKYTHVEKPDEAGGASNASGLLRERSSKSKNIDAEESERRGSASVDAKDVLYSKDRQNWELPGEKPQMDESSQAESSSYSKASQSNPSSFHPRSGFRTGVDISFDGSIEDENRLNSNIRFRRNGDPNLGRVHGNTWRGVPNWTAPLPNGFIPFQHGPPHGSFQSIMPQFPAAPPMFGIRPSLEINHSGIPYGMSDAERFPSHLHPLGWPNMLDGSSPSHLHGWDGNNGTFRDESRMYNGAEWDENRQMVNGRGWESRADMWRRQNSYLKRELPSHFWKNDHAVQDPVDDILSKEVCESPSCVLQKTVEMKPSISSSAKESPSTSELLSDTQAPLGRLMDDNSKLSSSYLSKLEISAELANPELYHQCGRLMEIGQSATVDEESAVCIIVEGGAIAVSMSSSGFQQSLSHLVKNSVFQRAIDLYHKQRMEMKEKQFVTAGKLDVIMASSEGRHEEQGLNFNDEKVKVPPSTAGFEISYEPISTTDDDKKAVETTAVSGKATDVVSTTCQAAKCLENSEEHEPLPNFNTTEVDLIGSEQQASLGVESDTAIPSDADVNIKETGNGKNSMRCGVGNGCFENAVSGPEVCASLILSRIHHSPESTH